MVVFGVLGVQPQKVDQLDLTIFVLMMFKKYRNGRIEKVGTLIKFEKEQASWLPEQ